MASSYTANKDLEKPAHNDYVDDWDVPVNANSNALDSCLGGTSYVNLTSATTYTLTYTDLQARAIVFTGTLSNTTVTIKLTNGVSFEGQIINATTAAGTSSILELTWTGAGNTFDVPQGASIDMVADGLNPSVTGWQPVGQPVRNAAFGATAGIGDPIYSRDLTGTSAGDAIALTPAQARCRVLKFTGTIPNGALQITLPAGSIGIWGIMMNVSGGGSFTSITFKPTGASNTISLLVGSGSVNSGWIVVTDGTYVFKTS